MKSFLDWCAALALLGHIGLVAYSIRPIPIDENLSPTLGLAMLGALLLLSFAALYLWAATLVDARRARRTGWLVAVLLFSPLSLIYFYRYHPK